MIILEKLDDGHYINWNLHKCAGEIGLEQKKAIYC